MKTEDTFLILVGIVLIGSVTVGAVWTGTQPTAETLSENRTAEQPHVGGGVHCMDGTCTYLPPKVVYLGVVELNATESAPGVYGGEIQTYEWTVISEPSTDSAVLESTDEDASSNSSSTVNGETARLSMKQSGEYVIELRVTNTRGNSDTTTITVFVPESNQDG